MAKNVLALGALILVLSNGLSRILGLARDALLAHGAGVSLEVDAYNLAFLIPDLVNHFLGAGLLPITLIPMLAPLLRDGDMTAVSAVVNRLLNVFGVVVLVLCGLAFWQMPLLLPLLAQGQIEPVLLDKAVEYSRILIFAQVFFVAGGFFNAVQYGGFRYFLPALAPLAYNGSIIVGGLIANNVVEGFCWGVVVGAFVGSFVFQALGAWKIGFRWRWEWSPRDPLVWNYFWKTLPFLCGAGAVFANEFVYRYFGASEVGGIATLGFGLRMAMAFTGVFGGALGVAVYPWFARLCSEGKQQQVSQELGVLLRRVVVGLSVPLIVVYMFAPLLVKVYLGSGAFDAQAIFKVSGALQAYLWQVVPMTALLLVNRSFYADQSTWRPSLISVGFFVVSLPIYGATTHIWGLLRVPWIATATTVLTLIVLLVMWSKSYPGLAWKSLGASCFRVFLLALVVFYPLHLCVQFLIGAEFSRWLALVIMALAILIFSLAMWLLLALVGDQSAKEMMQRILGRWQKKKGLAV